MLGFTPAAWDGRAHRLEVRVNRPGMQSRARRSYVADPPQSARLTPPSRP
ncbi:MAG: hypothetical protein HYY76_05855 [Acidobacteria bacterium]|nr:hypothetical protein [Acidobacteriota bacterium]